MFVIRWRFSGGNKKKETRSSTRWGGVLNFNLGVLVGRSSVNKSFFWRLEGSTQSNLKGGGNLCLVSLCSQN